MKFQRAEELYSLDWSKSGGTVPVGELDILMPKMPPEKQMVNYSLATKNQKFVRRHLPLDMRSWSNDDKFEYASAEWHRRWNGYWILIKGNPYYIPGNADTYFNYWNTERGGLPDFRFTQLEWWWFWWNAERDNNCYGTINYKSRRDGLTELALSAIWERATKWIGNQNLVIHIDKQGAIDNFNRYMAANIRMPWFYRPVNSGSIMSKKGKISYEKEQGRASKLLSGEDEDDFFYQNDFGLGSSVGVLAAVTGAGDGRRYFTYFSDEIFKATLSKFDVKKQWGIIKPTMEANNGMEIIGKTIKTSTVEEMKNSDTVELARELWKDSDPNNRMSSGRTVSGLYRYFRPFWKGAKVDEWGFPKREEAEAFWQGEIDDLKRLGKEDEILEYKRKKPATIEDALIVSGNNLILYPGKCALRLKELEDGMDSAGPFRPRGEFGNLSWKDGEFMGDVVWTPNPNGLWFISWHPDKPNSKMAYHATKSSYKFLPGNTAQSRMGMDPYDSVSTVGDGSDGAFSVFRRFDELAEDYQLIYDEKGFVANPERMRTNQFVCDYCHRPENPYTFYEHGLMTARYFGALVFPETNKDGFRTWMISKELEHWIQVQPLQLRSNPREKNPPRGAASSDVNIERYVSQLQMHIYHYISACHHPRIIEQWMKFEVEKRTEFDLAVATGFAMLGNLDDRYSEQPGGGDVETRPGYRRYE